MNTNIESYAFEPGQQVQCKTRFDDVFKGEVIAFDLNSKILVLKSPPSSGNPSTKDLHLIVLDSVKNVEILEEPQGNGSTVLPNLEMKYIKAKQQAAQAERLRLVKAVSNGVSPDGIALFNSLAKKYASDITWKDNVKIVVMNAVLICPPYKDFNCTLLSSTNQANQGSDSLNYVKSLVKKYWDSIH